MKSVLLTVLSLVAVATAPSGQKLAGEITAGFTPFAPVLLKVYDTTGNGFHMDSPCGDVAVFIGSQTGPQVPGTTSCGPGFTIIPAFGVFNWSWTPLDPAGNPWPENDYWFRVRATDPVTGGMIEDWFVARLQNSGAWLGIGGGAPQLGTSLSWTVGNGPTNGFFWLVASRTSNNPINVFGQQFAVSLDGIFNISVLQPQTLMTNSFGALDANGEATGTLDIPPIASLAWSGVCLQSLTIDIAGTGERGRTNPRYLRLVP